MNGFNVFLVVISFAVFFVLIATNEDSSNFLAYHTYDILGVLKGGNTNSTNSTSSGIIDDSSEEEETEDESEVENAVTGVLVVKDAAAEGPNKDILSEKDKEEIPSTSPLAPDTPKPNGAPIEILMFTLIKKGIYQKRWTPDENCKGVKKESCIVHGDRSRYDEADAVVFTGGQGHMIGPTEMAKKGGKMFVFASHEAWSRLPKIRYPDYFFNATMTYAGNTDIPYPFEKRLLTRQQAEAEAIQFVPLSASNPHRIGPRKELITAIISNYYDTPSGRNELVNFLEKNNHMTLYGGAASNLTLKYICARGDEKCVQRLFEEAYFFLALENTICLDYITEKYWDRVHYDTIPVTWSRAAFRNINVPEKSVIFLDDYNNVYELLKYLHYLANNQTAYDEYFSWRTNYMIIDAEPRECSMCRYVQNAPPKSYRDAVGEFGIETQCIGNFARRYLQIHDNSFLEDK